MNMEKFGGRKQELLVPEDKQEEFAQTAELAREQEAKEKSRLTLAEHIKAAAEKPGKLGVVYAAGAIASAAAGFIPGALGLGGAAWMENRERKGKLKLASEKAEGAEVARQQKERFYDKSRSVVAEGMKADGAVEVNGQLQATPEQIEIARKEMMEKYGKAENEAEEIE